MKNAAYIMRFLVDAARCGEPTALVTITGITGGSPRAPGAHMAISESGRYAGSLSGGCVEAAVIGEAKRVIAAGRAERLRLGDGSPFIDIRLPCGGGIDILLTPAPDVVVLQRVLACLSARRPVSLLLGQDGSAEAWQAAAGDATGWRGNRFLARHEPDMRLIICGNGAETIALARLAQCYGADILVLSPDQNLVAAATEIGVNAERLAARQRPPHLPVDPQTAVILLFHDHDWEEALLAQAVMQPAFFIGAMGSATTQQRRLARLAQSGIGAAARRRVTGPIGLIAPARDADTLALSALAQIVRVYAERMARAAPATALAAS